MKNISINSLFECIADNPPYSKAQKPHSRVVCKTAFWALVRLSRAIRNMWLFQMRGVIEAKKRERGFFFLAIKTLPQSAKSNLKKSRYRTVWVFMGILWHYETVVSSIKSVIWKFGSKESSIDGASTSITKNDRWLRSFYYSAIYWSLFDSGLLLINVTE